MTEHRRFGAILASISVIEGEPYQVVPSIPIVPVPLRKNS